MITSKVTSKGQTTLPQQIRVRLEVGPGDLIAYETTDAGVLIRRVRPFDAAWHSTVEKSLAEEWNSPEDAEDFGDL